jgi:hypothetical protein
MARKPDYFQGIMEFSMGVVRLKCSGPNERCERSPALTTTQPWLEGHVMATADSTVMYKDIPEYPGYRVGDDGSVWSCWALKMRGGRGAEAVMGESWHRLKQQTTQEGYISVKLYRNAKSQRVFIHVLVLTVFVGPRVREGPGGKMMVVKVSAETFAAVCEAAGLPRPVPEFRFAPPRRWRFDWVFLSPDGGGVALEIEGGVWTKGRHTRPAGFIKDIEKYNAAAILGYRVIRSTPAEFSSGAVLATVKAALGE